mmetsp:Transcript_590/g.1999  ORF Transcript_590/g.1999 Transcript_590/m.1999 type:complete len:387 (+) Transcript_590:890-2050(+)
MQLFGTTLTASLRFASAFHDPYTRPKAPFPSSLSSEHGPTCAPTFNSTESLSSKAGKSSNKSCTTCQMMPCALSVSRTVMTFFFISSFSNARNSSRWVSKSSILFRRRWLLMLMRKMRSSEDLALKTTSSAPLDNIDACMLSALAEADAHAGSMYSSNTTYKAKSHPHASRKPSTIALVVSSSPSMVTTRSICIISGALKSSKFNGFADGPETGMPSLDQTTNHLRCSATANKSDKLNVREDAQASLADAADDITSRDEKAHMASSAASADCGDNKCGVSGTRRQNNRRGAPERWRPSDGACATIASPALKLKPRFAGKGAMLKEADSCWTGAGARALALLCFLKLGKAVSLIDAPVGNTRFVSPKDDPIYAMRFGASLDTSSVGV